MELISIIEVVGGVLLGGGFLELIKWLSTRKSFKASKDLENKAKQQEIEKRAQGTVDDWERLSAQHEHDIEYYRSVVQDRDAVITQLRKEIADLNLQALQLSANVTQAQMLRCDTLSCASRIPPFGFKKINYKTGEIEE